MRKFLTLVLALAFALSLAACASNTPAGNTPTPSDAAPSDTPSSEPPVSQNTPDQGGDPPATGEPPSDDTSPAAPDGIPDNGTPPDAPAPFETHAGDKAYFYEISDDYLLIMSNIENDNGKYAYYEIDFFNAPNLEQFGGTGLLFKYVFESGDDAKRFFEDNNLGDDRIVIENVIYCTEPQGLQPMWHEDGETLKDAYKRYHEGIGFEVYVSEP